MQSWLCMRYRCVEIYSSYQDAQRGFELGTSQSRIGLSVHCSTHISLHLHPCPKLALHQYWTPTAEIGLQLTNVLQIPGTYYLDFANRPTTAAACIRITSTYW